MSSTLQFIWNIKKLHKCMMMCVSVYVSPCLQSFLKESPAATANEAHCEKPNVHVKDSVSSPLMPERCWALSQRWDEKPSPSFMLYIVSWTLKQYGYIQSPREFITHLSWFKTRGKVSSSYLQPFESSATKFIWRKWRHTKYFHKSKWLFLYR